VLHNAGLDSYVVRGLGLKATSRSLRISGNWWIKQPSSRCGSAW